MIMIMQLQHSRPQACGHAKRNQELVFRNTNACQQKRNTLEQVKCKFALRGVGIGLNKKIPQRAYRGGNRE